MKSTGGMRAAGGGMSGKTGKHVGSIGASNASTKKCTGPIKGGDKTQATGKHVGNINT